MTREQIIIALNAFDIEFDTQLDRSKSAVSLLIEGQYFDGVFELVQGVIIVLSDDGKSAKACLAMDKLSAIEPLVV